MKNMKILEQIKFLSIRGRVAFCIRCLENAIIFFEYRKEEEWNIVLSQLRMFTQVQLLDEWQEMIAEYTTNVISSFELYDSTYFEYLNEKDFYILKKLYSSVDESCCKIIDKIYLVGTINLYGSIIHDYGSQSLGKVKDILKIMDFKFIPLPNIECFKKYDFLENDGWGNEFIYSPH